MPEFLDRRLAAAADERILLLYKSLECGLSRSCAMNLLCFLFFLSLQAADSPAMPAAAGVYYLQDELNWIRLQPAPVAEMKIKGMDLFIDSGGFFDLQTKIVCRGAKAAVRISAPKPTFFIREISSSQDAMLVRLVQKKDKRVFQTSPSNATVQNRRGFKKEDVRSVVVTEYPDHSFSMVPEENLKPGEYLLVFGNAGTGFDFGID